MQSFETSATVEGEGELRVQGVPFPPGTRVDLTISREQTSPDASSMAAQQLFAALDKGRNVAPIGPLRREELYDGLRIENN
jgi:hypothetical protein